MAYPLHNNFQTTNQLLAFYKLYKPTRHVVPFASLRSRSYAGVNFLHRPAKALQTDLLQGEKESPRILDIYPVAGLEVAVYLLPEV